MSQFRNQPGFNPRIQSLVSALLVLASCLDAQAQSTAQLPTTVELKRGATLRLSLLTDLDSGHANVRDEVPAKLDRPLIADGAVVIPADWIVRGTVTKVKRAGTKCHDGEVEWKIAEISTPSGDRVKVQAVFSYPYRPDQTGDPEWVPLDTPLKKVGRVPKYIGLTVFVVALSPLLIPLALSVGEPCYGKPGQEEVLPAGHSYLYAVSTRTRIARLH